MSTCAKRSSGGASDRILVVLSQKIDLRKLLRNWSGILVIYQFIVLSLAVARDQ